jgi:uncharacterized protein involved in exopolysaccharide biosynthesis
MDTLKTVPPPEAKLHFLDYWRIIRIRKTVILAVFLLVVFTTVVVTIFLTPSYCGIAKIKVNKDKSDITGMFEMQYNGGYDPYFIEEERQTILSQTVLAKVIEKTGLNQSWGKKYADGEPLRTSETYSLLLRYLDLRPERNANIIEIRFYSQNKDEAARVANEIASTYREYRASLKSEMAVGGVAVLRQQLEEQEKLITQQQGKVNDLRSALQINEYEAQGDAPSPALEVDQLRRLDMQRIDLEVKYNKESSLLGALQTNTLEDLRNILPTVAADNLLHKLLVDLADAKSKLVAVKNDLGAETPK